MASFTHWTIRVWWVLFFTIIDLTDDSSEIIFLLLVSIAKRICTWFGLCQPLYNLVQLYELLARIVEQRSFVLHSILFVVGRHLSVVILEHGVDLGALFLDVLDFWVLETLPGLIYCSGATCVTLYGGSIRWNIGLEPFVDVPELCCSSPTSLVSVQSCILCFYKCDASGLSFRCGELIKKITHQASTESTLVQRCSSCIWDKLPKFSFTVAICGNLHSCSEELLKQFISLEAVIDLRNGGAIIFGVSKPITSAAMNPAPLHHLCGKCWGGPFWEFCLVMLLSWCDTFYEVSDHRKLFRLIN